MQHTRTNRGDLEIREMEKELRAKRISLPHDVTQDVKGCRIYRTYLWENIPVARGLFSKAQFTLPN